MKRTDRTTDTQAPIDGARIARALNEGARAAWADPVQRAAQEAARKQAPYVEPPRPANQREINVGEHIADGFANLHTTIAEKKTTAAK